MNHSFGGCVFSPPHKTTSVTTTSIDLLLIVEPKKQKDELQFFKKEQTKKTHNKIKTSFTYTPVFAKRLTAEVAAILAPILACT